MEIVKRYEDNIIYKINAIVNYNKQTNLRSILINKLWASMGFRIRRNLMRYVGWPYVGDY